MAANIPLLVDHCIRVLSNEAATHHATVKRYEEDGVLWAVFVADRDGHDEGVKMKKSSFLKLSTIQSSKAQSLIQMYNTCNHHTQFVCWFTLEDRQGKAMASKVMLVDAGSAAAKGTGQSQNNRTLRNDNSTRGGGDHQGSVDALEHLKNDMLSFQQQQQQSSFASSTPVADERDSYLAAIEKAAAGRGTFHGGGGTTPGRPRSNTAGAPHKNNSSVPDSSAFAPAMGGGGSPQQQYQQILRVSLQVADSVSKMGSTIDEMNNRMDHMQRQIDARPIHQTGLMDSVLDRLNVLEEKNAALETRIASFDKIQDSFFAQVNSLRQFQDSFSSSHQQSQHQWNASASSGHVLAGTGSNQPVSGGPTGSLSEEALISNGRFATAVKESTSPRSRNLTDAVAQDDGASSGLALGGSTPRAGGGTSPTRTPRVGGARSQSARSGGGGDSLSSMLASMEQRLSRIKTPK